MNRLICLIAFSTVAFAATPVVLELDQAIRRGTTKPTVEDLDLDIARTRVQLLEAMSRRRFELTPQLGLFSLMNPIGLATSVGAKLLLPQSEVSPFALLEAKIALLGAEIASRRRRFRSEVEVTRHFFEVAESQFLVDQTCAAFDEVVAKREQVNRQFSLARLTRADVIRHEQEIVNRQADCREAERRFQMTTLRLSVRIDVPVEELRVPEEPAALLLPEYPLQPAATLVKVAFINRAEPSTLRDGIAGLRRQVDAIRPPRMFNISLGYSRLGQNGFRSVNNAWFVGQGLQPEISARIPLKGNNRFAIEKELLAAEIGKLERELDEMEQEIRVQVTEKRIHAESRREEALTARKRAVLATELYKVVATRRRSGLENLASVASAEEARNRARLELARLEYASKSTLAVLLAICGFPDASHERQKMIVARPQPVLTSALP